MSTAQTTPVSLRDLLAQAAALAVKQEREGKYEGAYAVADAIINNSPETIEHRNRIFGIRDAVFQMATAFNTEGE